MISGGQISRLFKAPGTWDDEASSRRAEVLHIAHLFIFFGGILYLIIPSWFLNGETSYVIGTIAIALIGSALLRAGLLKWCGLWTTGTLWLLFTAGSLAEGGITSGSFAGTVALVVFAGLAYGVRAAIAISVMSIVAGVALVYLKVHGLLPTQQLTYTDLKILYDFILYITVTSLFTAVAVRRIERSTARFESELADRRRAEEALRESEDLYRTLISASPDPIIVTDLDGALVYATAQAIHTFGYTALSEVRSCNILEWVVPDDRGRATANIGSLLAKGSISDHEYTLVRHDGSRFVGDVNAGIYRSADGKPKGMIIVIRDITARKKAEGALQLSQSTYQGILNSISEMVYIQNERGEFLDVNRAAETVYGYSRDEFIGRTPEFLSAPGRNDPDELLASVQRAFAGDRQTFEFWGLKKDGTVFPKEVSLTPGYYFGEKAIIAVARDITERKMGEEAVRKSERVNRAIVGSVPDLLLRVDKDGMIIGYRGPTEIEMDVTPEAFLGKRIEEVFPPEVASPAMDAIARVLETRKLAAFEYKLEVHGAPKFYEARFALLSEVEVLLVIRDVTSRKEAEERLMSSLQEKELLLKEVHHRVKNNMQVISSLLSIQALEIQDEEMKSIFRESQSRVRSMALVHEKLYRSEDMARIDFGEYVHSLVAELKHSSFRRGVECFVEADPLIIGIDSAIPCGLIVHELMTNALKHAFRGREGGIIIARLRREGNFVEIVVEDNGIGIPREKDIHEMKSMGMTVVLSLAKQLNGTVTLSRNGGSRFTLTFPC